MHRYPFLAYLPPSLCAIEGDGAVVSGSTSPSSDAPPAPDNSGDTGAAASVPTGPNWSEFIGSLDTLNANLGGKLDTLVGEVRTVATPATATPEPPDYEAMSRPELVAHIVGTIGEAVRAQIAEAMSPLATQLNGLQMQTATTSAIADRDRLRSAHKDFDEWKDDMIALAKQPAYAQLTLPDLYTLARGRNAAKAATLEAKYNPPPPKPTPRWGGLTPAASGTRTTPVLSARDAGIAAYNEVSARHPGVLAVLEGL